MSRLIGEVLFILALGLLGGAATKAWHPRSPAWFQVVEVGEHAVTEEAVGERWGGEVLWVDARPAEAYEKSHREGAILLNEEQWNDLLYDHFETLTVAGKPIVVYCEGTRCDKSKAVAEKLRDLGLGEVYYLHGGWRR